MTCPANHPKLNPTVRVTITGAAGNIGYALLFRIASGAVFGPNTPVQLQLLERDNEQSKASLNGVCMELFDSAFPLLTRVITTTDPLEAFEKTQAAFLVGSMPRGPGMARSDLLLANGPIFQSQGEALDQTADRNVKVLVVGNPCNTNAYIAMHNAPSLSPKCFSAMMRLDHNRAVAQLAQKTGRPVCSISGLKVWGNHSNSMYPDISQCTIAGVKATELVDEAWYNDYFLPTVAKRGSAIIKARGKSSAASAASAAIDHMHDWWNGSNGRIVTMAVPSDGSYGVPEGLVCGFPCICTGGGEYEIVKDLPITASGRARLDATIAELVKEHDTVAQLCE
ncbi:malate dehydrogenase [Mesosutterella sp. AGMB02718]|uniref:Malate dehydrogenase n=1 Tax=Mesosutterella faecium TaxID=2925194 RepID=A0ABT7IJ60_9BURK|nr:malate dehydrogenase [Mesosutterella sp. AGMB02718]MDL2058415.1 malate dehydrogenase [Mesosutterella sp. AGMB02718]